MTRGVAHSTELRMTGHHVPHRNPMRVVDPSRQCRARTRGDGSGRQCKMPAMHNQQVCRMHGGQSPQALTKAEDRMRALVHPAVTALANLIANNDLAAARYVLDYAGFKSVEKVQSDGRTVIEIEYVDRPNALTNGVVH